MRALAIATSAALAVAFFPARAAAGDVAVLAFTDRDPKVPSTDDPWIPARLADLITERLELLGVAVRDRRFVETGPKMNVAGAGLGALVRGRVKPETALDPSTKITIEAEVRTPSGRDVHKKIDGRAGDLEKHAAEIAVMVAGVLGVPIEDGARAILGDAQYPFPVHRFLGLARTHADADNFRRAMVMYDRASELWKLGAVPEAVAGRSRAEADLAGRGEATFGARADLAPPAAERAEVALKSGDDREAMRALDAYLRYTPEHALRWTLAFPLARGTVVITRGAKWIVQSGEGPKTRWSIDPRTGTVLARDTGIRGLIDETGGHALVLEGKTLGRVDEAGRTKWRVELPVKPRAGAPVELTSGLAGIMGERDVLWVEVSFGSLGQIANDVRPLASGSGGIIVASNAGELMLLRPGKKSATWTAKLPDPLEVAMTTDRVLVLGRSGLSILRAHDGKEAAKPIALEPGAHLLGAEGRYAAVMLDLSRSAIIDVLAGEQTAIVRGPAKPIACYTAANGVAILYATGDLLFFDRDGALLDRALVPGEPLAMVRGSPMAPGPVVVTTRGIFAYAEVPVEADRMRDVDAMLKLAGALDRINESAAALRVAQVVAMMSAGRVDRAEELRAELLGRRKDAASQAAARWAKSRAEAARDSGKSLPVFRLIGG